jgi:hypothetical protein
MQKFATTRYWQWANFGTPTLAEETRTGVSEAYA